MKRIITLLASLAMVVGLTTGCNVGNGGYGNYYDSICVNPLTQIRMPDYYCMVGNPYYHSSWIYYVPYGYHSVGYGVHVTHYNIHMYSRPRNATIHMGGVSSTGGTAKHYSSGSVYTSKNGSVSTRKPVSLTKNGSGGGGYTTRKQRTGGGGFGGISRRSGRH